MDINELSSEIVNYFIDVHDFSEDPDDIEGLSTIIQNMIADEDYEPTFDEWWNVGVHDRRLQGQIRYYIDEGGICEENKRIQNMLNKQKLGENMNFEDVYELEESNIFNSAAGIYLGKKALDMATAGPEESERKLPIRKKSISTTKKVCPFCDTVTIHVGDNKKCRNCKRVHPDFRNKLGENINFEDVYKLSEKKDYNVTYATNGDLNNIVDKSTDHIKKGREQKAAIHGKPDFKYAEKNNWGPIPRSGVGRKEYNVKYSKSGDILEESKLFEWEELLDGEICPNCDCEFIDGYCGCGWERSQEWVFDNDDDSANFIDNDYDEQWIKDYESIQENLPTHTRSGKLIERRVRKISPALREAFDTYNARQHLIENKIIDENDLDLLEEAETEEDKRIRRQIKAKKKGPGAEAKERKYQNSPEYKARANKRAQKQQDAERKAKRKEKEN